MVLSVDVFLCIHVFKGNHFTLSRRQLGGIETVDSAYQWVREPPAFSIACDVDVGKSFRPGEPIGLQENMWSKC